MSRRSRGREVALQLLFQRDLNPGVARKEIVRFTRDRLSDENLTVFALKLFDGVVANQEDIDRRLAEASDNWKLSRMAGADRNILRLGAYEILHAKEDPPAVVFDEAIELARRYGTGDSSAFVNGVLDRLKREAAGPA